MRATLKIARTHYNTLIFSSKAYLLMLEVTHSCAKHCYAALVGFLH